MIKHEIRFYFRSFQTLTTKNISLKEDKEKKSEELKVEKKAGKKLTKDHNKLKVPLETKKQLLNL